MLDDSTFNDFHPLVYVASLVDDVTMHLDKAMQQSDQDELVKAMENNSGPYWATSLVHSHSRTEAKIRQPRSRDNGHLVFQTKEKPIWYQYQIQGTRCTYVRMAVRPKKASTMRTHTAQ